MTFHRLTLPAYYIPGGGSLPAGYDLLNDPTTTGGSGIAAPADTGPKTGGTYDGVYFIAGSEQASAHNANRGFHALGESIDILDDRLKKDLAIPTSTGFTAGGGGDASCVLNGSTDNIWVSDSALTPLADLFEIVDRTTDNELLVNGNKVVVSAIAGAAVGAGFTNANPLTLTFNETIPATQGYRVYYAKRGNLADLPTDVFSFLTIRTSEEVTAPVQKALKTLHASSGQEWDTAWDATIKALASAGLNERYRRATAEVGSFTYNTAGDGAVITRDGRAPESHSDTNTAYVDPINANWVSRPGGTRGTAATPANAASASTGYVSFCSRRSIKDALSNEDGDVLSASSFLALWPHDFSGVVSPSGQDAWTQVTPALTGTLNPSSVGGAVVELGGADYFVHSTNKTAIMVGYDVLEITVGGVSEMYIITALNFVNKNRCTLRTVGGTVPNFAPDTAATFRWHSTLYMQGGASHDALKEATSDTNPGFWGSFFFRVPPILAAIGNELANSPAIFMGRDYDAATSVVAWGGFDRTTGALRADTVEGIGLLRNDGSISARSVSTLYMLNNKGTDYPVAGTDSYEWDPRAGSVLTVHFNDAYTLTVTIAAGYTPTDGDRVEILVFNDPVTGASTVVWPATFLFSGSDATITAGTDGISRYSGVYSAHNSKFLMTKTAY